MLIAAASVTIAQWARTGAQRDEQAAALVEATRADSLEIDVIRLKAIAEFAMNRSPRVVVSPALVAAGSASWYALQGALARLARRQPTVAAPLRRDATLVGDAAVQTLAELEARPAPGRLQAERVRFGRLDTRLDDAAQQAAAHEQRVAAAAASNAQIAFTGSLVVGLLALALIALRFHRLRRRLAVAAARAATEVRGEARLRALLEQSSDIVTVVGSDLNVRWQAASITRILGHGAEALLGRPLTALVHPDDVEAFESFLAGCLTSSGIQAMTVRFSHASGGWRTLETVANNRVADPAIGGLVLSMRDTSERTALEDQLRHQAYHDALTGLANRSLFENRLTQALASYERTGREFAVLFLDVDDFKTINDSLGHARGDELLCVVADRIGAILRPTDTAARLGGDEFAVLLELAGEAEGEAAFVARRVLEALGEPLSIGDRELRVTASLGLALSSGTASAEELLRNADVAMYAAKADGGGVVREFAPSMHERALERLELTGELHAALERDEFVLVYQPIVELDSGRIVGVEALVRWRRPDGGLVAPGRFISLAEDNGLIVPLGGWILETACRQCQSWWLSDPPLELAICVNVSTRQLRDDGFVDMVAQTLARTGLAPELLTLEITEGVLGGDREPIVARLRELKELGVRIAIDDFGTGYSSLSHLRSLPVDALKIDKSFVDGIERDGEQAKLVRGILNLGESLQLSVVAEGIERPAQREELLSTHRPLAQGFLFHAPMPAAAIERMLRRGRAARARREEALAA